MTRGGARGLDRKSRGKTPRQGGNGLDAHDAQQDAGWRLMPGETPGTIVLTGEIDFSVAPRVRDRLWALVQEAGGDIVLDMAGLTYIDSSGLALLLELRKLLEEEGRGVRIRSIAPQVRKLFDLTQLAEVFGLPDV